MSIQGMNPLPRAPVARLALPGHQIPGEQDHHDTFTVENQISSNLLRTKHTRLIGTLNTNTLFKLGKMKQLTDTLEKFQIKILAIQETRFVDENHFDTGNYRIYKGKLAVKINNKGPRQFGTGFAVHKSIRDSVVDFSSTSERISTLSVKSANKAYT